MGIPQLTTSLSCDYCNCMPRTLQANAKTISCLSVRGLPDCACIKWDITDYHVLFCMGRPQFTSDDCKMSPWSPHVQPEIFLKIEHCKVKWNRAHSEAFWFLYAVKPAQKNTLFSVQGEYCSCTSGFFWKMSLLKLILEKYGCVHLFI